MNLKTVKFILTITFLTIVAAVVIGSFTNNTVLIYIMMAFFVIFAAVYMLFWRCPECKKHLGKLTARSCKHCGHKIDLR